MPPRPLPALVVALLTLTSCVDGGETWTRGTAGPCDSCTSDLDCKAGLLCDQDSFACKSVEQLKAKKLNPSNKACDADCWKECLQSGGCYALPHATVTTSTQCAPKSTADCAASEACKLSQMCVYSATSGNGWPACVK